jgi:hypothetical protein
MECGSPLEPRLQRSQAGPAVLGALLAALWIPGVAAVNVSLTQSDTQRALRLAGGTESARAQLHAPYIIPIRDSVIHEIQVLTEFRRTVLAAEDARARGDWAVAQGARSLTGHGIADVVNPWRGKITISATLQLDPLHTYVSVPKCEVMLAGVPVVASLDRRTSPRSSVPYAGRSGMTTSLVGASLEADFDAAAVAQTSRAAVVICEGKDVARTVIDFSRLE